MSAPSRSPGWVREVDLALTVHSQIMLTGNVRDLFLLPADDCEDGADDGGDLAPVSLLETIERICARRGFGALAVHDVIGGGFTVWPLGEAVPKLPTALADLTVAEPGDRPGSGRAGTGPGTEAHFDRLRRALVDTVGHRGPAIATVFPYTARLGSPRTELPPEGRAFFAAAESLAYSAREVPGPGPVMPYNTVFWVVERQEELPVDFVAGNRALRVISIPLAPPDQRLAAAAHAVQMVARATAAREAEAAGSEGAGIGGPPPDAMRLLDAARTMVRATSGMGNAEILAIGRMALDRGLPAERLDEAARLYRIGVVDNPWTTDTVRERIRTGEEYLNARVIGQPDAVRRTVEVFMRSAADLTGAQSSSSPHRPRGVLFLSGPTGVGKTELAKGIATMIFGDDATPARFDMSEFAQEHARDRLIGAPPGFIGHEAGGELTNAVRANPMSVLLFDEIDKADPRLFDLFLQILEDGRLTDGRGATVYFSECVLIFTSNLGVVEQRADGAQAPRVTHADDPKKVHTALVEAFEDFFDRRIRRPELRNRFGDGFVAMDFVREDSVPAILGKAVDAVARRVAESHGAKLQLSPAARAALRREAVSRLAHGGRGVNNAVEAALVNPLARELFGQAAVPGETIMVDQIDDSGGAWHLEVRRWSE